MLIKASKIPWLGTQVSSLPYPASSAISFGPVKGPGVTVGIKSNVVPALDYHCSCLGLSSTDGFLWAHTDLELTC